MKRLFLILVLLLCNACPVAHARQAALSETSLCQLARGAKRGAVENLSTAIDTKPKPEYFKTRAKLYSELGEHKLAEQDLRTARSCKMINQIERLDNVSVNELGEVDNEAGCSIRSNECTL